MSFHIPSVKDKIQIKAKEFPGHILAPKPVVLRSIMENDVYSTLRPLLPHIGNNHGHHLGAPHHHIPLGLSFLSQNSRKYTDNYVIQNPPHRNGASGLGSFWERIVLNVLHILP